MSVCLRLAHKLNTIFDKVGVLIHEDLVPVNSVHLMKVCVVVVKLSLSVELECPRQSEVVVGSHIAL